jgi:hypothetical protein
VPRGTFVAVIGVVAAVATNVPYCNWYGFPGSYTAASMLVQIVGFLAAGLVAARVIGAGSTPAAVSV